MRSILRSAAAAAAFVLVILGGCAGPGGTSIKYYYEPGFSFPGAKTYQWGAASATYRQDPLLEANVRFQADRQLQAKGMTQQAGTAALIVWMEYEFNPNITGHGYELQALTLNVSRPGGKELVWRGLAWSSSVMRLARWEGNHSLVRRWG